MALRSGRPHRASGELAFHVLDIMHAFHDASREGKHVELKAPARTPAPMVMDLLPWTLEEYGFIRRFRRLRRNGRIPRGAGRKTCASRPAKADPGGAEPTTFKEETEQCWATRGPMPSWSGDGRAWELGHGFLESVYQEAMATRNGNAGIPFEHAVPASRPLQGPTGGLLQSGFHLLDAVVVELRLWARSLVRRNHK